METFEQALRRIRSERGHSLADLGKLVAYSRKTIHDFEAGRRHPQPQTVTALDQALSADGYLIHLAHTATHPQPVPHMPLANGTWRHTDAEALAHSLIAEDPHPDNALTLAHEWLVTDPPQIYELKTGRHINTGLVDHIEQRVHQIRLIDDHAGGLDTYATARRELETTAGLLRDATYSEQVGRRLLAVIGQLAQICGWIASDAGHHGEAQRLYLAGARAAHAAGDKPGAASNLSSLAYQLANVGDPREAVLLARSAYKGAQHDASASARALLLERVAWAHARAGEPDAAGRALDVVDDVFDDRQPDMGEPWTYWLDRDEVDVMQGRVWTQLQRPLRAVPVLEAAIGRYPADAVRETALYLTWLAEALVQGREVDRAAEVALRAHVLAGRARSARLSARVGQVRGLLVPYRGTVTVDEFLDAAPAA